MDKSWMELSRVSQPYIEGVKGFIKFAYTNKHHEFEIKCPCKKCWNTINQKQADVYEHLIVHGFQLNYTDWIFHGESSSTHHNVNEAYRVDEMTELVHDAFGMQSQNEHDNNEQEKHREGIDDNASKFFKLLMEANCELFEGCKKYSLLSFIVRLFHMKVLYKWSNISCSLLLQLLKDAFPVNDKFRDSYQKLRKIVSDLGFNYEKIHACPNHCMLYRKENEDYDFCKVCHTSRWKHQSNESNGEDNKDRKIPVKVVRYFPLKPSLQRLFMSSKTASLMRWHAEERTNDGILRHPTDSPAWKNFDQNHPDFSCDCRNVRLGLSSDGFNPFKTKSIAHSSWPIVLSTYNLPLWMCMKQPYLILSTLIDGPHGPGNKIDVYLQPLIDELNELWKDGIDTYDAVAK